MLFGLIVLGAAWEWGGLMRWAPLARALYTIAFVPLLLACYVYAVGTRFAPLLMSLGLAWWIVALGWILRYQAGSEPTWTNAAPSAQILGWLVLAPAWTAMVDLHTRGASGPIMVLALLCLIWAVDISAYFAGRRFGTRRLASRVSPGKTWEGVAGGVVGAALVGMLAGAIGGLPGGAGVVFVLLCIATVPVSVVGDLAESLFKRQAGLKDSGCLLPGHGGVLDRIDSLTAAAPFFALGWIGLGM